MTRKSAKNTIFNSRSWVEIWQLSEGIHLFYELSHFTSKSAIEIKASGVWGLVWFGFFFPFFFPSYIVIFFI